jgi:cysteinyl-tRNA synthetase
MDGLQQAASSVARLRNFAARLSAEKFPAGTSPQAAARAAEAATQFEAGLADDLNTAQALAAIFDLVRDANTAMDRGEFRAGDATPVLETLTRFDRVFAVMEDHDAERLRALGYGAADAGISDEEIERLIAERQAARKHRDFTESDRIRQYLLERGILIEDTRDGSVRWKRK